jgi:alkanesulfonate monooxygenase SsuD/methylene tetrahydromethanopterin reductase-like flavin-dependent oxidoreductase (luciferase family)
MTCLLVNAAWARSAEVDPVHAAAEIVRYGGDGLGFPDSPRLFADPFVTAERVLASTDVPLAGPCVVSMGLRHPATVAAGLATLAAAYPGRVLAVLARGESAVRNEGLRPPRLSDYLGSIEQVRDRLGAGDPGALILLGAASGPRTLAATAQRTDGVLIDVGADTDVTTAAVATVRGAAPASTCWLFLRVAVTDSPGQADERTAPLLGSCASRMAAAPGWYEVPTELLADVAALARAHDYTRHGHDGAAGMQFGDHGRATRLVRNRFFVTGSPAEVTARIRALTAIGIDGIVLAGAMGVKAHEVTRTVAAVAAALPQRGEST